MLQTFYLTVIARYLSFTVPAVIATQLTQTPNSPKLNGNQKESH